MNFDEVRVELSVASGGGLQKRVSMGDGTSCSEPYVPPPVDAAAVYHEWFDALADPPAPAAGRDLQARRRAQGEALYESLFGGCAGAFERKLDAMVLTGAMGIRSCLRVRLELGAMRAAATADPDAILPASSRPHELMVSPRAERFLARNRFVSIVRTIGAGAMPPPVPVLGPLRALVVSAVPADQPALGWEAEVERIRQALAARQDTRVEVLPHASFEDVTARLRAGFHILHFIGHGGYDAASGEWCLVFEQERASQRVVARDIADRFSDNPMLRLAVLNACHSGELARTEGGDVLAGLAAALSIYGVPAVVGMQVAVTDSCAIDFASAFYGALREGQPVEIAVADGRGATRLESPEWATPVLYLRGQNSDLFQFQASQEGPVTRDGELALRLGIRTFTQSPKFPHLAEWARNLDTTTERLLALEEFFDGRRAVREDLWPSRVLPRLDRFLGEAAGLGRPLDLKLAAHASVAFAAGYYLHTKPSAPVTLVQMTGGRVSRWTADDGGAVPAGPPWEPFEERQRDPGAEDVAVAVEISQGAAAEVESFLQTHPGAPRVGRLVVARIVGGPGGASVTSGAHAHRLAWELHQWLKNHTGNRAGRRLHLFLAAPNGFVFFFGQLALSLGKLSLYEYDFEATAGGTYERSVDLSAEPPVDLPAEPSVDLPAEPPS